MKTVVIFPEFKDYLLKNPRGHSFPENEYYIKGEMRPSECVYQLKDIRCIDQIRSRLSNKDDFNRNNENIIGKLKFEPRSFAYKIMLDNLCFNLRVDDIFNKSKFTSTVTHQDLAFDIDNSAIHVKDRNISNDDLIDVSIVDYSGLFLRVNDPKYPLHIYNEKKVGIIGLGSGGSLIAKYLASAGIKKEILIDDDRIEVHNIIRHQCSLRDIGRYKTIAVRDFLLERIPDLEIITLEKKFGIDSKDDEEKYMNILGDIDLLISATGDHKLNFRINQFAYRHGIPAIYAGTFDKISGGIMIKIDPSKSDACYNCIYDDGNNNPYDDVNTHKITSSNNNNNGNNNNNNNRYSSKIPDIKSTDVSIAYDRDLEDLLSQPGLGVDIDNITIFVAKFALSKLLNSPQHNVIQNNDYDYYLNCKSNDSIYHFPHDIYIWYNRDIVDENGTLQNYGLELYYIASNDKYQHIKKRDNCPICNIRTDNT